MIPHDCYLAYLRKAPERKLYRVNGFTLCLERDGSWCWERPHETRWVAATPFWEGIDGVPVEVSDGYNTVQLGVWPFTCTGNPDLDMVCYVATMSCILPPEET